MNIKDLALRTKKDTMQEQQKLQGANVKKWNRWRKKLAPLKPILDYMYDVGFSLEEDPMYMFDYDTNQYTKYYIHLNKPFPLDLDLSPLDKHVKLLRTMTAQDIKEVERGLIGFISGKAKYNQETDIVIIMNHTWVRNYLDYFLNSEKEPRKNSWWREY